MYQEPNSVYIEPNADIADRRFIIIGRDKQYRREDLSDKGFHGLIPWLISKHYRGPICPKDFKVIEYEKVKSYFRFPPNHPVKDMAYATCNIVPDLYIPIANFHDHFQQMKHASFVQLCANLGAKEVIVHDIKIDNETVDMKAEIPVLVAKLGLNYNKEVNQKTAFSFSENNRNIKPYESPWIETEPTWESMINTRKNNFLKRYNCEYNYTDDFGINGNLVGNLNSFKINIGGSFTILRKINIKYEVIFWQ